MVGDMGVHSQVKEGVHINVKGLSCKDAFSSCICSRALIGSRKGRRTV